MRGRSPSVAAALAAAAATALAAARPAAAEEVSMTGAVDAFVVGQGHAVAASDANPGNRILRVPGVAAGSELRPSLTFALGGSFTFVVRPRFAARAVWAAEDDGLGGTVSSYDAELVELFGVWIVSDTLTIAYGLQNFQWGPAETVSPSNRLFHQTGHDVTPLTVWYGKHLVRVNLSLGKSLSAVVLLEPIASGGPVFQAGETFSPAGQLKVEVATDAGDAYAGVTAGEGETRRPWFGEYAMWEPASGLSIYVDVAHTLGSPAWYPIDSELGPVWATSRTDEDRLSTFAVAGVRYTFEHGLDLRLEAVHDDAGWTPRELERAIAIVRTGAAAAPEVVGPYVAPGLELVGRDYAYLSVRLPDVGPRDGLTFHARALASLHDGSTGASLTADWILSDSMVATVLASGTLGDRDAELTRFVRAGLLVALRHTW
jgi:hypothetical protein